VAVPAVLVAGIGAGVAASGGGEGAAPAAPAATAGVERRDLVERESVDGSLGYADARPLRSGTAGTVTWLPSEGAVIRRGGVLMRVDTAPTVLMYGTTPVWRDMRRGDRGADVRQLQRNLAALGHDPDGDMAADGEFGWATAAAVRRWQEAMGLARTGTVTRGQVVFLPSARRVGALRLEVGDTAGPGQEAMTTTATTRTVTFQLDARCRDLVRPGARERVELPDGTTVAATVSGIGTVARTREEGAEPTVEVTLALSGRRGIGGLDQAPVEVELAGETRRDVLAVPVTALLALAGGGHGLEVVGDDGRTSLVPVRTGASADGWVEVRGPGLRAGMRVVVAS